MQRPGLFLITLGLCLAGFLTYLRSYNSILLVVYQKTDAKVTSYRQDPPGLIREGDWRLEYEFVAEDGQSYRNQITFAPKKRPADGVQALTVRYFPKKARISEADGHISYKGLIGYAMAISFIFRGILYLVVRKQNQAES